MKDKFKTIEETIKKAQNSCLNDPQLASMLSSYLVVFISGIYEDIVEYLFIERAGKNNDEEIKRLVKTFVDRQFRNPEYDKIKELLKALDPKYEKILQSKIDTKNKMGLNSIVENKNKVAHGENSNATLRDVVVYHNNALKIFETLENILQ